MSYVRVGRCFTRAAILPRQSTLIDPPKHFYSLDVLRGCAALGVVLWHWQHFFLPLNPQGEMFVFEKQPMFDSLHLFYKHGWLSVELFFCLSGFIFFWLYSNSISKSDVSLRTFAVLRLSRLYPLHFATLVLVAVLQLVHMASTNTYFVYQFNDIYHFILNLFFVSSWGLEKGGSFNAPVWSVSVEMFLYAIFFVFCRFFHKKIIALLIAIVIGHYLHRVNGEIANGIENFFIGGGSYFLYEKIIKGGDILKVTIWLPVLTSIAWLLTIFMVSDLNSFTRDQFPWVLQKLITVWPIAVLFPITIMLLALLETKRETLGKRLSFVGDISYSSYLLHFPLQLVAAMFVVKLGFSKDVFYSSLFMFFYFVSLIIISFWSHRYFEMPM
jgi:peptidoglycan/LPS O-acetylase OafA/YrhL